MREIKANIEEVVDRVRAFLNARLEAGDLVTVRGKVSRHWVRQKLDLGNSANFSRNPQLQALIADFDAKLDGYLDNDARLKLEALGRLIMSDPPLDKNGVTLNRTALSKALGIALHKFSYRSPYQRAVDAEDVRRREEATANPLIVSAHGRFYDFRELALSYGERSPSVVEALRRGISSSRPSTGKSIYLSALWFLRWLASASQEICRVALLEIVGGRIPKAHDWDDAVHHYREYLIDSTAAPSLAAEIKDLRPVVRYLAAGGIVPPVSTGIRMPKNANRLGGHRKSIVEVIQPGTDEHPEYQRFVRQALLKARLDFGVSEPSREENAFLESLDADLREELGTRPASIAATFLRQLNRRLDALSRDAWTIVENAQAQLSCGRAMLQRADIEPVDFEKGLLAASTPQLRSRHIRTCFPIDDEARSVANLLRLGSDVGEGTLPSSANSYAQWGQFFQKRYLEFGSFRILEGYLYPTADAVGAALTLYLCDAGANLAVAFSLNQDCIESSDLAGHVRITGYKARAAGKAMIVDLPSSGRSVRAMRWIRESSDSLRSSAAEEDADLFFLVRMNGRVQAVTEHWYGAWFKRLVQQIPELHGLRITPSMIRHSILLRAALENDGRLQAGRAIGQHTEAVTEGYQRKWVVRLIYDENIKRFQEGIEALMLENREHVAERLGISIEELGRRVALAKDTGLGTLCLDRSGRPGSQGRPCVQLDCASGVGCPQLVLVAEVEAIAHLQLWQRSLRAVQGEWERDHPQRWEVVWLPWLCLADVVEEKMTRGKLIQVWKRSSAFAAHVEASVGYVPPRPW